MSFLITIKRVPSKRDILKMAKRRPMRGTFSYWRFGKQYSLLVESDGRVFDSRKTLFQRFARWVDKKNRMELYELLNARLSKNDAERTAERFELMNGEAGFLYQAPKGRQ